MSLYHKHRPRTLEELIGQDDAVKVVKGWGENVPQAILATGPSGCGKTSTLRIIAKKILKCSKNDLHEHNCAEERGIDFIRGVGDSTKVLAWSGGKKVWILDEIHAATGPGMQAMLKVLEDSPKHCWFMLATTDPDKLLKTIRTRCSTLATKPLSDANLSKLVRDVAGKENRPVPDKVVERIVEAADGSARQALVILEQVIGLEDEADQLNAVISTDVKRQGIDLAKAVFAKAGWDKVAAILKDLDDDVEAVRRIILGWARGVLLRGKNAHAYRMLEAFEKPFDTGKAGHAGLMRACWEVLN